MRPSDLKASLRHLPWGLLGMTLFVLVIERSLAHNHEALATNQKLEWMITSRAVRREAPRSQILCFGDSLVKVGLAPTVLEHRSGKPSYNFALSGGQTPASYFLLRRALRVGARPTAILVDFKWTGLQDEPRNNEQLLPELAGPWDFLDLAWTARDASLFASLMVAKFLPSALDRYQIRSVICARLKGEPPGSANAGTCVRDLVVNRGAFRAEPNPRNEGQVDLANKHLIPDDWHPHPVATIYLKRFVSLAQERGICVFWLMPPVIPELQTIRERNRTDYAFIQFARRIQDQFPNLVVVDGRSAGYPHTVFVDTTHLDRLGAVVFTDQIVSVVERALSRGPTGARWIALPRYKERPAGDDSEQSAQAVAAASQRVRQ